MVGLYVDSAGNQHGSLMSGGYFSVDYPVRHGDGCTGDRPRGDVVGSFTKAPEALLTFTSIFFTWARSLGFMWRSGVFTTLDYSGK